MFKFNSSDSEGYLNGNERIEIMSPKDIPKILNAFIMPCCSTRILASGAVINGDKPNPIKTNPTAKPFFQGTILLQQSEERHKLFPLLHH